MALLTTGLIRNTEVSSLRPSSTLSLKITNPDPVSASVRINGFYGSGSSKTEYVLDLLTLAAGEAADYNYFAQFDAFEFRFVTSSDAVSISAWGKNAAGELTTVHPLVPVQLFSEGRGGQIYIPNSGNNSVAIIDEKTNTRLGNVIVGSGPCGLGVNPLTNRIYVANFGSNNVSVIDGSSNTVIATITVGINPVGVGVNPETNKIYVTNRGGHNVSVLDGFAHVVIATIAVGESPEGVNVNPATNRIYIRNHGSNNLSVINGSTNTVIATIV
jgi:YVTN family beta-propeller protein